MRSGKELFTSDFRNGSNGWSGGTNWAVHELCYRQPDPNAKALSFAGEDNWTDYTLSLKARKLSGAEGFLVLLRVRGPQEYVLWNLGGWHNEFHGLLSHLGEQDQLLTRSSGAIETGRWYEIKVVLKGTRLDCYLDGKLLHQANVPVRRTPEFFASATREDATGEIILKVVNPTSHSTDAAINLPDLKSESLTAQAVVLTGSKLTDENSFDEPSKIAPVKSPSRNVKPHFDYTFQPYSLTVLRIGSPDARSRAGVKP
jgi:alpha-L-arabinofuranosidase